MRRSVTIANVFFVRREEASGARALLASSRRALIASSRRALTLFEVVLAVAIFFGAATVLSQLYSSGTRAALRAKLESQAVMLADSKMSDVLAGVETMDNVAGGTFADPELADWSWSLVMGEGPHVDLLALELTVTHAAGSDLGRVSWTLRRYVRDPQVFIDAALEEAAEEE